MELHAAASLLAPRREGEPAALALGTMNFGKRTPEPESARVVARALERGIRIFDTANVYNEGESERILGRALGARRGEVLIASKVGFGRVAGKPEGLSRAAIARAIDGSRQRLGVDRIDLYYLHVPDHATPIEETLDAVQALVENRHIGAWGVSNYASWQILEMMQLADARRMPRPVVSQVIYNALIREIEIEHLAFARRCGVHLTTYNALAGGLLSGKHRKDAEIAKGSRFHENRLYQRRYWTDAMFDHVSALAGVASDEGMSLVDLAYAWAARRVEVSSILVGPADVAQLDAAIDGCAKRLSEDAAKRIDDLSRARAGTDTHYVR